MSESEQCRSLRRPRNKICLRRTQLVRRGSQSAPFDHVNRLNTGQQNACTTKRLEAEHGPDDALDGSIVLLYDVVQRLHLPQVDRRAGIFLNGVDGSGVGATLVDGDLVRQAVLAVAFRRRKRPVGNSWRMDETYMLVAGQRKYLYRAVDRDGATVDFLLTAKRDLAAARRFLERAIGQHDLPD